MKKIIAAGLAMLLVGGTATAAMAAPYHSYGHANYGSYNRRDRGGDVAGAGVAAGILGLAIGAIASSQSHDYYAPAYCGSATASGLWLWRLSRAGLSLCGSRLWVWRDEREFGFSFLMCVAPRVFRGAVFPALVNGRWAVQEKWVRRDSGWVAV